jgi:formylglycine-generating enzyme required for sulfatase activity
VSSKKFCLSRLIPLADLWVAVSALLVAIALSGAAAAPSEAQPMRAGQMFRDCSDCPEMVVVPAGSFTMGSSAADTTQVLKSVPFYAGGMARAATATEQPDHRVTIARPFALGKYLVTRGEFAAFVHETGYLIPTGDCFISINLSYRKLAGAGWEHPGFPQTERDPVLCVSWQDAEAYVGWLNGKLRGPASASTKGSGPYHLPREAEWEYAARAGTQTARWWGDAIGAGNADCKGCGSQWDNKRTAPVGSFRPNPFGLYDMLGNAWEWTADCWNDSYEAAPEDGTSWTTGDCWKRVARGGDWENQPWVLRSAARTKFDTLEVANFVGFRVAKALP